MNMTPTANLIPVAQPRPDRDLMPRAVFPPRSVLCPAAGREARLLDGLRARDDRAYEALVREYGPQMLAVARRLLRCEQDAADALQDAFVSAFQGVGAFAGTCRLSTWLHRITVNACLMRLRAQGRRRRHEVALDDLLPGFDDTDHHERPVAPWADQPPARAAAAELRARVRACIDRLPQAYRLVLLLRDIEELDTAETARLLGCSPANVKTRLHRARLALRTLLVESVGPVCGAAAPVPPNPLRA